MVYGDNPALLREYEDALGLSAYTYAPNILAVRQSGNLYVYCLNNPLTWIDPSGLNVRHVSANHQAHIQATYANFEPVTGREFASATLSFVPYVNSVKDAQEAITGVDLLTGRQLSPLERVISGVAVLAPVSGGTVRAVAKNVPTSAFKLMSASDAAKIITTAERTGTALSKTDTFHRSASFLTQKQLAAGQVFTIKNSKGVNQTLLQVNGTLNGKKGVFEYIITPDGKVSHQLFKAGGTITGKAN